MKVTINFTLDIDPAAWATRSGATSTIIPGMELFRVEDEVRAHAENVVRDLFADMGWTVESANA